MDRISSYAPSPQTVPIIKLVILMAIPGGIDFGRANFNYTDVMLPDNSWHYSKFENHIGTGFLITRGN